jgi:hypothetical protein
MIKSYSYSPGYIAVLKCAVSNGRIYICVACFYCDCRVDFPGASHNNNTHHICIFCHQKQHILKP